MRYTLKVVVYVTAFILLLLNAYLFSLYKIDDDVVPHCSELTIQINLGRLGNQMFTFASLYGIAKLNNRDIRLMPYNFNYLAPYFDLRFPQVNLSVFEMQNPWKIGHWLQPADRFIPPTSNILLGNIYPTSFTFFHHVQEEIRKLFRFKPVFQAYAHAVLRHIKKIRPWAEVFVGVHVRRGDYLAKSSGGWLRAAEGREVDVPFFQKAVQYFRTKYNNTVFLAVSEDRRWTREKLSPLGVLTLPEVTSPGYDLALLSACNHTIMSYGTFGFWAGYLAAGEVVYFSDFINPKGKMAKLFKFDKMYLSEWVGISTTPENFWDNYTNPFI